MLSPYLVAGITIRTSESTRSRLSLKQQQSYVRYIPDGRNVSPSSCYLPAALFDRGLRHLLEGRGDPGVNIRNFLNLH